MLDNVDQTNLEIGFLEIDEPSNINANNNQEIKGTEVNKKNNLLSRIKTIDLNNFLFGKISDFFPEIIFTVIFVALTPLVENSTAANDLNFYHQVAQKIFDDHQIPVFGNHDFTWAYPPLSLIPLLLPYLLSFFNPTSLNYRILWYLMIFLLDFGVVKVLKYKWNKKSEYSLFSPSILFSLSLVCLGPVSIARFDSFTVPLLIVALIYLEDKFSLSIVLINFCGWIKIFAFFYLFPIFLLSTKRIKIFLTSAIFPVILLILSFTFLSFDNVFEFFLVSQGRGLQIESIFATPAMILDLFTGKNSVEYNNYSMTNEIPGVISEVLAALMNYLLLAGVLILGFLTYIFYHPQKAQSFPFPKSIIYLLCLDFWLLGIIFNKIGSPQFYCLLMVPILVGLLFQDPEFDYIFKLLTSISLVILLCTQICYPFGYTQVINLNGLSTIILRSILALRNILVVYLFYKVNKVLFSSKIKNLFEKSEKNLDKPQSAIELMI